jgi:hypothetical protein
MMNSGEVDIARAGARPQRMAHSKHQGAEVDEETQETPAEREDEAFFVRGER